MLQTEMLSLEQEKNSQFSPVSFDELSNILGGKKSVNNGNQKPTGSVVVESSAGVKLMNRILSK